MKYIKLNKNNTSGFRGVSWFKYRNKWHASLWVNYRNIHLGYFSNKLDVAKVYNKNAIKYFGEFARLNKI